MVKPLPKPKRALPEGYAWIWALRERIGRWTWCRIHHRGTHTPDGHTPRSFGPLYRFDPHEPSDPPTVQDTRSVLYVAANLTVAVGEVFGESGEVTLCPNYRVALLEPTRPLSFVDLAVQNGAMRIGALPSLGNGDYPRSRTQEWARAIFDDQPLPGRSVDGVRYSAGYSAGPSLAVWAAGDKVRTVLGDRGTVQDFQLASRQLIARAQAAADELRMPVNLVAKCPSCAD